MKKNIKILFTLFFFCLVYGTLFPEGIDLDDDFSHSKAYWDGSEGLYDVVNQLPIGACQVFAHTAFMEYIFYRETGKTIKLSD